MYSQAPNASFSGTCETAKHHVFQVPNSVKKTQPLTSLSEDLKAMYSQAPKASFWGTCETAKHKSSKTQPLTSLSEDLKTMYSQASKASSWMYSQAPKASSWETQPLTSLSKDLKTMYSQASKASSWMYSQAPKASSWGTCETAKQHPKPRPGAPAKQPKSRQKLQKSNPQAPSIRTGLLWRAPPYSEGSADSCMDWK